MNVKTEIKEEEITSNKSKSDLEAEAMAWAQLLYSAYEKKKQSSNLKQE